MTVCLEGIRVLELARAQAGPRCGLLLRDLGAEVLKIEKVGGDEGRGRAPVIDGVGIGFAQYNRGKKSITLNMRDERAKEIFRELVKRSDIVLENFRPGVMDKMGFGYKTLNDINPRIILVSGSGFGQYGPYRDRPAYDVIGQAMSGIAYLTGEEHGTPILAAAPIIDRSTALHLTIAALAALFHRQFSGRGQWVEMGLLDSALTLVDVEIADCYHSGKVSGRAQTIIQCKDGSVAINPSRAHQWQQAYKAIGREDVLTDPKFGGLTPAKDLARERQKLLREWAKDRTVAEVTKVMEEADVPSGPVQSIPQVIKDRHMWERRMMVEIEPKPGSKEKILVPGETIKMSDIPWKPASIPTAGEHNQEIYAGLLGLSAEELAKLVQDGVI